VSLSGELFSSFDNRSKKLSSAFCRVLYSLGLDENVPSAPLIAFFTLESSTVSVIVIGGLDPSCSDSVLVTSNLSDFYGCTLS
jgi:hypothetical protein